MAGSLKPLADLGRHVAATLDEAAVERARALEEARRGYLLVELSRARRGSLPFGARSLWAGAVALSLAAATVLLLNVRRAPLSFEVNGVPGVAKTWLAAPHGEALRLHFSEGTQVRLDADSKLRIVELSEPGASLSLESGHVHCEVVHRAGSAWKVVAGPFTVRVTGTVFDVNWDPNSEQLAVSVTQGSVAVRGANLETERVVHASETLHASSPERRAELAGSPPSGEVTPSTAPQLAPSTAPEPALSEPVLEAPAVPVAKDESSAAWRAFAKRGALREAFASADAAGFTGICASASPGELLLLGDGARLSGKPERATEALLALRRRFPGDARRGAAAFALGKVAFDQRHAYEQAAEWFATSLREQPGGPLAREAEGRLIEALRAADDSAGARRAARDYLSRYPEGPHADLARSVLH